MAYIYKDSYPNIHIYKQNKYLFSYAVHWCGYHDYAFLILPGRTIHMCKFTELLPVSLIVAGGNV